jgi:hypothetical protein
MKYSAALIKQFPFIAQFDRAREEIKTWPKWMQEAAVVRSASFPKPPKAGAQHG